MTNFSIDKMYIKYFVQILDICTSLLWFLHIFCWFFPKCPAAIDTFVPNVLGINLIPFSWSYDQNWLRETLKTEKKAKTPPRSTFWNNRLHVLTKTLENVTHTLKSLNLKYYHHTTPGSVNFLFSTPLCL